MSNITQYAGTRERYVSSSANDDNDGSTISFAKKYLSSAVSAVNALSPPPALLTPAAIIAFGASSFAENLEVPDNVQVDLRFSNIFSAAGYAVTGGSNSQAEFQTIISNDGVSGGYYKTNGATRLKLTASALITNGDNSTAIDVGGATRDFFCSVGQIAMRGNNANGLVLNNTGAKSTRASIKDINMEGTGCKAISGGSYVPSVDIVEIGSISDTGGAGNYGLYAERGNAVVTAKEIDCETAILVKSGAHRDVAVAHVSGDIVVESGGELNITAIHHSSGVVSNSGIINGTINGIDYGSSVVDGVKFISFYDPKNIDKNFKTVGFFTMDTATETMNEAVGFYLQSATSASTVTFEIVDATSGDIYFTGTVTDGTSTGPIRVPLAASVALPASTSVDMVCQVKR